MPVTYSSYNGIFGVWFSGFDWIQYNFYTYCFEHVIVGTHVGNDPMFMYNPSLCNTYNTGAWTSYDCDYPSTYINTSIITTYLSTYGGISLAHQLYKNELQNIRAVYWV